MNRNTTFQKTGWAAGALCLNLLIPGPISFAEPCGPGDFRSVSDREYAMMPDGKKELIGTTCRAGPADIPKILDILKDPPRRGSNDFNEAHASLVDLLQKDPGNRTQTLKTQLFALAKKPNRSIQDSAFDCLMQFRGDPDVRKLFIDTLHNHPSEYTRGGMTGKLMVNTENDLTILPELRKALSDPSEYVRVRATQDLARQGDYSGVPILKKILTEIPVPPERDRRISEAARAAGEVRHIDLLEPLKRLAETEKQAPTYSSAEAQPSAWLLELKYAPDNQTRKDLLRQIAGTELGISWIDRSLLGQYDALGIDAEDLASILSEFAKNPNWRISYAASSALKNLERYRQAIPSPNRLLFKDVHDAEHWRNPFLIIHEDAIEIRGVGKVPPEDLVATLFQIPKDSWPYGRVIAVQNRGINTGDKSPQFQQKTSNVLTFLKELGVGVEHWPSASISPAKP